MTDKINPHQSHLTINNIYSDQPTIYDYYFNDDETYQYVENIKAEISKIKREYKKIDTELKTLKKENFVLNKNKIYNLLFLMIFSMITMLFTNFLLPNRT